MSNSSTQLLILSEGTCGGKLQKGLEAAGFCVVMKQTVHAGVSFAEKTCPDLIIVGSYLGDTTIIEFCYRLRQLRCYIPLIVYSEPVDEFDRILALEAGADDYMSATTSLRELVARIRAQLRRTYEYSKPAPDILKTERLFIDCSRGQVYFDRRLLALTPIEFRLLKFLVQHRDQVLSRTQILNQIWGYELQSYNEEMVNVHICRLRRKIEVDPLKPTLIMTVRGLGYRLVSNPECAIAPV